jgi:hypothetical protein
MVMSDRKGLAARVWSGLVESVFGDEIARRVEFAVKAIDRPRHDYAFRQNQPYDRLPADRSEILEQAIKAVRQNPMAKRILGIMTQYVIGGGVEVITENKYAQKFIDQFWNHRLNKMDVKLPMWCDELGKTGNLFIAISTDESGMSYVRCIPSLHIAEIHTAENDIEQEKSYTEKSKGMEEPRVWKAYDPLDDDNEKAVMVHYAVNRAAGASWGESDLAPVLKWLRRHAQWLEDRVRLNHFRQLFMFVVRGKYPSEEARRAREKEINANPPVAGSTLVMGLNENWGVLHPQLDSFEASEDGLNIKKMITGGVGYPLHFLAEPEGTNRTTAEFSGGPTFRQFEQRQKYFLWLIEDILKIVLERRRRVTAYGLSDVEITVRGGDMSVRDNEKLADAANKIYDVMYGLYQEGLIGDEEILRMVYRYAGEHVDVQELLNAAGDRKPKAEEEEKEDA